MIGKEGLWVSIVISLFVAVFLTSALGLIAIFVNKFNLGGLVIGKDYLEIPGRWKKRIILNFSEIKNIGEFETYDHIIEIESENGFHLIEKQWMKKKDFDFVRNKLIEYTTSINITD
jgi:hypothetical protein